MTLCAASLLPSLVRCASVAMSRRYVQFSSHPTSPSIDPFVNDNTYQNDTEIEIVCATLAYKRLLRKCCDNEKRGSRCRGVYASHAFIECLRWINARVKETSGNCKQRLQMSKQ